MGSQNPSGASHRMIKPPSKSFKLKPFNKSFKIIITGSSSDSSAEDSRYILNRSSSKFHQEHGRPKSRTRSNIESSGSSSGSSIESAIERFRSDFEIMKCKMKIFGESLDLCACIAKDYQQKMSVMEQRLKNLEKKHFLAKTQSNYSVIIQKNKKLSLKTLKEAKKLQMCGTEEEMRVVAGRICRNYLHGAWKTVDPAALDFKRISGGLSNFIYYVALPEDTTKLGGYQHRESSPDTEPETIANRFVKTTMKRSNSFTLEEPKKVLLRIYGQVHGERAMDAIVTESVIFTLLSERRLGPRLHGVFSGGRIEEYIPANSLKTRDLAEPALSMKIAEKMAAIHSMDIPLSKEPNWIWKTMGKWLKTVKEERLKENTGKNEDEERIITVLKNVDFDKEIEWLKNFLNTIDSPVVFCHNDMQEGNILLLDDSLNTTNDDYVSTVYVQPTDSETTQSSKENNHTKEKTRSMDDLAPFEDANTSDSILSRISDNGEPRLVLIDFEYCAYNHRGFDIANHFQEWMYDYTNPEHPFYFENTENAPTLEQKEIFIKEYLKHYYTNMADDVIHEPTLDEINHLLYEVDGFALASHLFWTLWSVVNASKSQIPFGYWEYALARLETYQKLKQEIIKKEKLGLKRKICEVDI